MNSIVILTPTYNRASTLPKLYESLREQNNKDFDWIIVDDGSKDETKSLIKDIINQKEINTIYISQQNGGKARALNTGFSMCDYASVIMVVDSDDYLLPTAVDTLTEYMKKYDIKKEVGAFFFHYNRPDGKLLKPNGKAVNDDKLMTRYQYNNKYKLNDGCVCYLGRAINKYRYPEFKGEKYVGPTVIQMEMADEFKIVFSPRVVGVAEYLESGLSKSGRLLRLKNPMGMMYYSKLMTSPKSNVIVQIKSSISIWVYAKLANKSIRDVFRMVNRPILLFVTYIPGQILYLKWSKLLKN